MGFLASLRFVRNDRHLSGGGVGLPEASPPATQLLYKTKEQLVILSEAKNLRLFNRTTIIPDKN